MIIYAIGGVILAWMVLTVVYPVPSDRRTRDHD